MQIAQIYINGTRKTDDFKIKNNVLSLNKKKILFRKAWISAYQNTHPMRQNETIPFFAELENFRASFFG